MTLKTTTSGKRPRSLAGPRCKVCRDPRLYEISAALASGASINSVAKRFDITGPTLWKHARQHIGAALADHNISQPVLDQIRRLNQRTLRILDEAERGKGKDPAVALQAIREARRNLELIAKLTGELKETRDASEPTRIEVVYVDRMLVQPAAQSAPAEIPAALEPGVSS